jgi:chromosome segregation protein
VAEAGGRPSLAVLGASEEVRGALSWALRDVYVVPGLNTAAILAGEYPGCAFVTPDGESAGAHGWAGGEAGEPTAVLALAGAEEAERRLESVGEELGALHRRLADADHGKERSRDEVDAATVLLQESDGRITAAAERLQRLEAELVRCERELAERQAQAAGLATDMAERQARLTELETRGVEEVGDEPDGPDLEAERLDDALSQAREAEVQARLEARSVQNRRDETTRRVTSLRDEADDIERQLARREARRVARVAAAARCGELLVLAEQGLDEACRSLSRADTEREAVETERAARREGLGALRARLRELDGEQSELTAKRHTAALSRGELETAAAGLRERLAELRDGDDPDRLLATARGARDADSDDAALAGGPERDDELATAPRRLERQLGLLGDVNPLAKLEFERLTERHGFLESQLEDLRASRNDLLEVVEAVDVRIKEVFAEAFADVAAAFGEIFPRLFPGGEGHLVLTDPDDLLNTGVEVEARPAGKRVKRLSLLSGGERSLTALAIMFAIFAARPSPFYVLDEVEAALDDVNLQRFLDVVGDFRSSSQLIIVTHQKRTMEVADVLYGVTMQRDGVSKVISQRAAELTATT